MKARTYHRRAGTRRLIALCAATLLANVPGAMAQGLYFGGGFYGYEPPPMISPRGVAYRLQDRGFTEISRPRFDGRAYVVEATNPVGARVRLFVDPVDGVVLGRQRLDTAYYPSARPVRPGYGWTEEDLKPRRTARADDGLVPPANIPQPVPAPRPPASLGPDAAPEPATRAGAADPNPLGVNPDAKGRPAGAAARKTARLNQPQKPVAARIAPAAPVPKLDPADQAKPAEPATAAVPKDEPATPVAPSGPAPEPSVAAPSTPEPAVSEPQKVEAPVVEPVKPVAEAPKKEQGWQDPPAGEKKVRVIDGATMVPGDSQQPSAN